MVEWIDYSQNTPLSKVRQEHSAIKDSRELFHAVLAVGGAGHFPPNSYNALLSFLILIINVSSDPLVILRTFFCKVVASITKLASRSQ